MEQKQYFVVICVVLVGIMIGAVGLVYVWLPKANQGRTVANPGQQVEVKPEVHLYKKAGGLILRWDNLPAGTQKVTIYRTKLGGTDWKPWKTFDIDSTKIGSGFIEIKTNDDLKVYMFYAEAVGTGSGNSSSTSGGLGGSGSGGGNIILWQSSSTTIEVLPPNFPPIGGPAPSSTPTSTSGAGQGNNASSTTPPNTTPPSSTSTSQTSSSTAGSGSQGSTSTGVYYAPDGTITGTAEIQHDDFWVEHVNQSIEVGWQNIPTAANLIIVYRSTGESGPWLELFRQDDPASPSSLRLLDNTLTTAHYYRMEARKNSTVLKNYGPVFLPAYQQ
jgi:hypothetical protein